VPEGATNVLVVDEAVDEGDAPAEARGQPPRGQVVAQQDHELVGTAGGIVPDADSVDPVGD
jgi:hypothetical protein